MIRIVTTKLFNRAWEIWLFDFCPSVWLVLKRAKGNVPNVCRQENYFLKCAVGKIFKTFGSLACRCHGCTLSGYRTVVPVPKSDGFLFAVRVKLPCHCLRRTVVLRLGITVWGLAKLGHLKYVSLDFAQMFIRSKNV